MPGISRLTKRSQFVYLRDHGSKLVMPSFVIQYLDVAHLHNEHPFVITENDCALGFTLTKKLGHAVRRNRIKRRLREMVAIVFPELAKAGYAYVVIGRYRAYDADFDELLKQGRAACRKMHPASSVLNGHEQAA